MASFVLFCQLLASFILVFLVPGFLLFNLVFRSKKTFDLLEVLPISFCFNLIIFGLIGFPAYILHLSWHTFILLFVSFSIILLILNLYCLIKKKIKFQFEKPRASFYYALTFSILGLVLVILLSGSDIFGDRLVHTGIIRRLADSSTIRPDFIAFKDVQGKIDSAYGYNIWYLAVALLYKVSHVEVNWLWKALVIILTPLSILSFYFWAKRFSKQNLFILISLIIFFIFSGIATAGWEWRLLPYPDQIARNIVSPVIVGLFFVFLKSERIDWRLFAVLIPMLAILPLLHMFSVLYMAFILLGLLVFGFLAEKKYQVVKKVILLIGGSAVIAAPILYSKALTFAQIVPTSFGTSNNRMVKAFDLFYVANPSLWSAPFLLIALGSLAVLVVWKLLKKEKLSIALIFGLSLAVLSLIVSFVPPLPLEFAKIVTSTFLARLSSIVPTIFINAILLYEIIMLIKWRPVRKYAAHFLILVGLVISVFVGVKYKLLDTIKESLSAAPYFLYNHPVYDYIEANIPADKIIAANKDVSYELYARTDNYLIMIPQSHCPAIIDKRVRLEDQQIIIEQGSARADMFQKVESYQVDYILAENAEMEKFGKYPKNYQKIYENTVGYDTFALYKVISYKPSKPVVKTTKP